MLAFLALAFFMGVFGQDATPLITKEHSDIANTVMTIAMSVLGTIGAPWALKARSTIKALQDSQAGLINTVNGLQTEINSLKAAQKKSA